MTLDRDTILAVSSLISLVLGAILLSAQIRIRPGAWAVCWGAGTVMLGLAGADQALKGILPTPWLVSSGNVVAISGYVLIVQGVRLLAGRAPRWKMLAVVLALIVLPLALSHDPAVKPYRVAYNNALLIVCDLWVACEAFRLARREQLGTAWIMVALFGVTVPFSAMRLHVAVSTIMGSDTLDHARVGTWLAALLAAFWSLRGAIPALLIAERSTRNLASLARHDALTGALNRAGLEHLAPVLRQPSALLLLDMDHFKTINDRYGHAQGDGVLKLLATTVSDRLPGNGIFARLGGDEFLIVLPGATEQRARDVAETIRSGFSAAMSVLPFTAPLPTISIGVTTGDLRSTSLETLISAADTMLYRSKEAGRDRISSQSRWPDDRRIARPVAAA